MAIAPVTPNRRQLLQGTAGALLLGAARPATGRAEPLPTDLRPDVTHRGRAIAVTPRGDRVVVAHAGRPTLAIVDRRGGRRRTVQLGGHPLEVSVHPDGTTAAVSTAWWSAPGVEVVRLADGAKLARLDLGPAPLAVVHTHDGRHLLVAGGEQDGTLHIVRGQDDAHARVVALGRVPRGLAASPARDVAWVVLQADDAIAQVDLRRAAVTRRLPVPALPDRLAVSPDGRTLLVSHGGHGAHTVSEVDVRSGRVRTRPVGGAASGVGWGPSRRRLAVVRGLDAVVAIDAAGHRQRIATVAGPRGLAVSGRHAFTVSAVTGEVGRVRA